MNNGAVRCYVFCIHKNAAVAAVFSPVRQFGFLAIPATPICPYILLAYNQPHFFIFFLLSAITFSPISSIAACNNMQNRHIFPNENVDFLAFQINDRKRAKEKTRARITPHRLIRSVIFGFWLTETYCNIGPPTNIVLRSSLPLATFRMPLAK